MTERLQISHVEYGVVCCYCYQVSSVQSSTAAESAVETAAQSAANRLVEPAGSFSTTHSSGEFYFESTSSLLVVLSIYCKVSENCSN